MARWCLMVRRVRFLATSWGFMSSANHQKTGVWKGERKTNLRDTLLVHAPEQDGPGDPAGVLALEEQRLGLAIEKPEDLGVAADIKLALFVGLCQKLGILGTEVSPGVRRTLDG